MADKSAEEEVDEDDEFKPSPRRIAHPPPQLSRTHMSRLRNAFLTVPPCRRRPTSPASAPRVRCVLNNCGAPLVRGLIDAADKLAKGAD